MMLLLIRKILKKAKTGVISNRKIVPEKSNINLITLKTVNDSTPSSSSSSSDLPLKDIKAPFLQRQCTVQELDETLAKLRQNKSIRKNPTPTYYRYSYNATPPQLYQNETQPFENEFAGNASSTVSEEDEEYVPVKARRSGVIRRISSKQRRFSSPPIRSGHASSIDRCFSQNSERFQFRLSQNLLPSIPIEEDALSITETTSLSTPLPDPMQPIVNCYH